MDVFIIEGIFIYVFYTNMGEMKNINYGIGGMLMIGLSVVLLTIYDNYNSKYHLSPWLSTAPVYYLIRAETELNKKHLFDAKELIDQAVYCIQSVESYTDGETNLYVQKAVDQLNELIEKIDERKISSKEMKRVYFYVINTVAYTELIVSENKFLQGKRYESLKLMKTVLRLLNDSLIYSLGYKSEETLIIQHVTELIDSIEQRKTLGTEQCDAVKLEMTTLLEALMLGKV